MKAFSKLRWMTLTTVAVLSHSAIAVAQTNSWISPSGGKWHAPHWSGRILPGSGQTILITNAGSKMITINEQTIQRHPETLEIGSLIVSASATSINTLLLDSAGFIVPLSTWDTRIAGGGALVLLGSSLRTGEFLIEGAVFQSAFSEISADYLRSGENGVYY
jgi:hypothetical protein